MGANADKRHRQKVLTRGDGAGPLCTNSALCVLLFYCLAHGFDARVRHGGYRFGARRTEGRHRLGQTGQVRGGDRTRRYARRRLRQHGHHSVEDVARGGALPHRDESARAVRRQLPRQREDHPGRPAGQDPARDHQRDRRGAKPADAQPSRPVGGARAVHRPAYHRNRRPHPPGKVDYPRQIHRHRHRHHTGTPVRGRLRRRQGARLRRDPRPQVAAGVDGGGGRRCDRHRIRVDVRRIGHQGDRRGEAQRHAGLLSTRRSSRR